MSLRSAVIAMIVAWSGGAAARPVSFVGSKMPMLRAQPMMVEASVDVTPVRRLSVGATYDWLRRRPEEELSFAGLDLNLLLLRHNGEDLQANAFLLTTTGALRDAHGAWSPAGIVSLEIDGETRGIYVLAQARYLRSVSGTSDFQAMGRLGLATYPGEFDQLNPWIIVQYQYMPSFAQAHTITPMLRLMYRNTLFEIGASLRGEPMINFVAEL